MKMLKTIALTVITPTLIKAVEDGYSWACKQFEDEPEAEVLEPSCTRFTTSMRLRIVNEHNKYLRTHKNSEGTLMANKVELKNYLNKTFRMNKSLSSYARVWNKK